METSTLGLIIYLKATSWSRRNIINLTSTLILGFHKITRNASLLTIDLLDDNGWNVYVLAFLFHPSLLERIQRIYVSSESCDNFWVWQPSPLGLSSSNGACQYQKVSLVTRLSGKAGRQYGSFQWAPKSNFYFGNFCGIIPPPHTSPVYCNSNLKAVLFAIFTKIQHHILLQCLVAFTFWSLLQSKTGLSFRYYNSWVSGTWPEEGQGFP